MISSALSEEHRNGLLKAIGCEKAADLFMIHGLEIPSPPERFPPGCSEYEITDKLIILSQENKNAVQWPCFLGGGFYHHFIPGAVEDIAAKQEFWTPQLPIYPEVSQGTLTALFEYQSLISRLTGMDVACSPVGSAGEALAGAILAILKRFPGGGKVLIPRSVNPYYVTQARWILRPFPLEIEIMPSLNDGSLDLRALDDSLGPEVRGVAFQCPNYFGVVENIPAIVELTRSYEAVLIEVTGDVLSLGLLKPPGDYDLEIACGDLQSLGIPLCKAGFSAGFLASSKEFTEVLPGRLVAETEDMEGLRVFVDIAKELPESRAGSELFSHNIICAIRVAAFLALVGGRGIRQVALLSHQKARFARQEALRRRLSVPTANKFFNEFPIELDCDPSRLRKALLKEGLLGGIPLGSDVLSGKGYLFAFTEMNKDADIIRLMEVLSDLS
jgi:glycine dehydrogenase subunit 1